MMKGDDRCQRQIRKLAPALPLHIAAERMLHHTAVVTSEQTSVFGLF